MTPAEAAVLLAGIAKFDNRKPGTPEEADLTATLWSQALHDVPLADAGLAVTQHFATSTEYLMPAHIRTAVKRVRSKRIADGEGQLTPPPEAREGAALHRWLREAKRRLGDGEPVEAVNPPELDGKPRHLPDIRALMPAPDTTEEKTDE